MTLDIFMPFYGSVAHFTEAVNSVLAQEDPDWRLVIVDDVYPDLSAGEWASSLDDPRVTYLRNEVNLRPSRNYIKCVGMMESEFGVLMGCDDIMLPGYVARVKELISQFPKASIFQPGVEVIDGDSQVHDPLADRVKRWYMPHGTRPIELAGAELAQSLLRGNWTYFPSLVWRVSELKRHGFRTDLNVVQDLAMLFEITKSGGSLVVDDQVVFQYRRHGASYSAVTGPDGSKFAQERVLFAEADAACTERGWTSAARAARNHLTSRLNALSELPAAIRHGNRTGRASLLRHVFGPSTDR